MNRILLILGAASAIALAAFSVYPKLASAPVPFSPPLSPEPSSTISILFAGDMMFDRTIRSRAHDSEYQFIFENIFSFLHQPDVVVANLEGTITENSSKSVGTVPGEYGNTVFTFDPKVATVLKENNIAVVNIGNNHNMDFGADGVIETKNFLESSGVQFFGDPLSSAHKDLLYEKEEMKIEFINYNEFSGDSVSDTQQRISLCREKKYICVVYTHWGDEYVEEPPTRVVERAHAFVDAGADLIIGSHPHVIQRSEDYKNARIYYSLGNFVFDQYFSSTTQVGLGVLATVKVNMPRIEYKEYRFKMDKDGRTSLAQEGLAP